ncbi:hypothetical protein N7448_007903 [Penicillium atrosanguineum]|uniref:Uncharacterized protein n=1 Tax=Penicillium atrosanguineum TaxID=1132637 RepID=A0A9W9GQJ2_9EURO|nr:uncharacterized protein N7443_001075 [Penicillium atrosanguineum]KAJ5127124.1 hypothetical protein N7448_007903 [Penicillium atrosanguineum]KAJ5147330.1 hypothetical protein N7526_000682 [Penicillium atrosanguineum]KAJ5314191.1 hypothetical protein N7443_001075 [Penicillium atrosanguineum]KAJ5331358.1 hypothetical protein N7476_001141 [Penicillium atrosanguineum]
MKILTKEEEDAHYRAVVKGGTIGGVTGLAAGVAGVMLASRRFSTIRNLTMPMKAFLTTSSGTFVGIIAADHASREFETQQNAEKLWYENREERLRAEQTRGLSFADRTVAFARREKYKIIGATWIASIVGSFMLVNRNPFLSSSQKIVQARVYAQGLTLGVLCASAAFEISDQRRGRGILDAQKENKKNKQEAIEETPARTGNKDEGDLWKDMVAAEEQRLKNKHQSLHLKHAEEHVEAAKESSDESSGEEKKDDKKDEKEGKSESESESKPKSEKLEAKKH